MATGGSGIDRTHDEITVEVILKVLVSVWYNGRHRDSHQGKLPLPL